MVKGWLAGVRSLLHLESMWGMGQAFLVDLITDFIEVSMDMGLAPSNPLPVSLPPWQRFGASSSKAPALTCGGFICSLESVKLWGTKFILLGNRSL